MSNVCVLALDGVPYSLLKSLTERGIMPHVAQLIRDGSFREMNSVQPPISSSAWASFLTGGQPAQHGILGFTERNPRTMEWFTPDARHLKMPTLLQLLSQKGKRVFSMNVPVTSPPSPINGISIGGFLATDICQATYPPELADFLIQKDYRIDADVSLAKTDFKAFIQDLEKTLERRLEMLAYFYGQESWDFFMAHIMETDRLHHFTFEWWEDGRPEIRAYYDKFYGRIDAAIGQLVQMVPAADQILMLSDHGFTGLKKEVYLNRWLWENGYLRFSHPRPDSLQHIHPQSKAYALYPGRLFINLQGREKNGTVQPGMNYEQTRQDLREKLLQLRDPESGALVIKEVLNGEAIYGQQGSRSDPQAQSYADLLLIPHKGFELKGVLWHEKLFDKSIYNGMHSFDNAFFLSRSKIDVTKITDISNLFDLILKMALSA